MPLRFDIITIFPKVFQPILSESIIRRAREKKKVSIHVQDLRAFAMDKRKTVDDRPFGGGPGMILMAQPLFDAIKKIKGRKRAKVILTCPTGKPLTQALARRLAQEKHLIIICGHYEGVDERVREALVDETISIGDYVLTGGEIPAMVLIDCVTRLIPGVLGKAESLVQESFEENLLDHPQFTRPANFRGMKVPDVLLSGNHQQVNKWRLEQSRARTQQWRPDLLSRKPG
ncbi:MAG: tRNA (guanosine(37)-N1)-methyltransferase TrmD [Candidatus Omnitrophota bacterium]|nr:tRNA (guanosine(37)-N1)-methyltransferase TrmD [Candidatus Omnitrophota bacterium]